jgi:2-polyprenyl-6-methoxyphenol hydroxylase-like FAD-dependent oxidoreductase/predicted DsbA family dithiol-disulfide isomerase
MKAVIIGGGIAGLTQGIFLKNKGIDVVVYERVDSVQTKGHAFLMNGEGLQLLKSLSQDQAKIILNKKIDIFSFKRPNNEELIKISLDDWHCIKRIDLISYLISFYNDDSLKFGFDFSHFEYGENKISAAVFKNGQRADGDLFIGADGSNSVIRQTLFGPTKYTPIEVKELVGISSYFQDVEISVFQKFQSDHKGLSFGFIPAASNQCVWFMQYDVRLETKEIYNSSRAMASFCRELLKDFPAVVGQVLNENNFETTYCWNTHDFDLLPSFHMNNVVLIGDAAHLSLPFTSAGTTNAIKDAKVLTDAIFESRGLETAFSLFYKKRYEDIERHIQQGRDLKNSFLSPKNFNERGFILPLISDKYKEKSVQKNKLLTITYFTDPICSSCWLMQPLLRKIMLDYGEYIEIDYRMGGLLPSWESYTDKRITNPSDAAQLWEEIRKKEKIPITGDIWLEDPLMSSYPSSIAFKSAQRQDKDKAVFFLRRLKEMLFMEKININNWENIEKAALYCGLDSALLHKNMKGEGLNDFKFDLELARDLGIHVFPTLIFQRNYLESETLKGLKSYQVIEETIVRFIPNAEKSSTLPKPLELFKLFNNMTTNEFAFLLNIDEEMAEKKLEELLLKGHISKSYVKDAAYWQLNT